MDAGKRVFRTLEEVSEATGQSVKAVSIGIIDRGKVGDTPARWAYRVYALKIRSGEWVIAMLNSRGNAYMRVDTGAIVKKAAVMEVRDVTSAWYFPKEEE